ncbi:dipicolinate synthase subunit A [Desulfitispora alkaliphila]|uniref:dipicolinate synthase subunit DpsA n=1 Tax=Desulfitispora alkaliphila TaxID=622674 RepID=UPI003D1D04FB
MELKLNGINISVLGGDNRELVLIPQLIKLGAKVKAVGFPSSLHQLAGAEIINSIDDALEETDVVILPMPGTDQLGNIRAIYSEEKLVLTEKHLKQLQKGTPIIMGVAKDFLKQWAIKHQLKLIEIAEQDEVAILNAIPTAEGTIKILMEQSPITIHNSKSIVLGLGRVGFTVARTLAALGSKVMVVVRKEADKARGFELGYQVCTYETLPDNLTDANFIINTVPAKVINRELLTSMPHDSLIVDLATQPGGTDFQAAEEIGINAMLAPGLPGKVAPKTAGEILARVIPKIIKQHLKTKGAGGACDGFER